MTIFQKLSWMVQMGIRDLCGEKSHPFGENVPKSEQKVLSLSELDKKLSSSKSSLSSTATHPLGGVGVVPATVMCILESPSASEDKTGVALSGTEGELLKKMLSAIDLDIQRQTYVGYLSPWRAPGARMLTSSEVQEGLGLLNDRIKAVNPQVLLIFGVAVARALLKLPLGQARSGHHEYQGIPAFSTYAPSFLLKNDSYRRQAWEDLKKFNTFLNGGK